MKKTLPFAVLFFTVTSLFAQYIPIPDSGAAWSMQSYYSDYYNSTYAYETYGYKDFIFGDTTIDNIVYHKVYTQATWWKYGLYDSTGYYWDDYSVNWQNEAKILLGGLRQDIDNKTVFFRRLNGIENFGCIFPLSGDDFPLNEDILLFDFDVEVGDTVVVAGNYHIIESIDSVQYNDGIYRQRFSVSNGFPPFCFIEGIGTDLGLFASIRGQFVEGELCNLNCFAVNDNYIIGDGIYNCDSVDVITVPVVEIDLNSKLKILPNPFNEFLKIELSSKAIGNGFYQINLYNLLGEKVKSQKLFPNQQLNWETKDFPAGVYLLTIYDESKLVATEKLIKR